MSQRKEVPSCCVTPYACRDRSPTISPIKVPEGIMIFFLSMTWDCTGFRIFQKLSTFYARITLIAVERRCAKSLPLLPPSFRAGYDNFSRRPLRFCNQASKLRLFLKIYVLSNLAVVMRFCGSWCTYVSSLVRKWWISEWHVPLALSPFPGFHGGVKGPSSWEPLLPPKRTAPRGLGFYEFLEKYLLPVSGGLFIEEHILKKKLLQK